MGTYLLVGFFLVVFVGPVSAQLQPGGIDLLSTLFSNNGLASGFTQPGQLQIGDLLALLTNNGGTAGLQVGPQQQLGLANLLTLLGSNGTGSGLLQTAVQQPELTSLLTTLLSNNEAALAVLQTPEIVDNFAELFSYLNTTGNITGVIEALRTDPQVSALSTTLLTLLFESLSLTVFRNNRVSDACQTDMIIFIEELVRGNPWALRMLDAMGKPVTDLATLNTRFVGSYEECVAIKAVSYTQDVNGKARERGSFDGEYCSLAFDIPGIPAAVAEYAEVEIGLCVPNTCGNKDVETMATILERAVFNQTVPLTPTSSCKEGRKEFGTDFIVVVGILAIFGCLILIGTIYDVVITQKKTANTTKSETQTMEPRKVCDVGNIEKSKVDTDTNGRIVNEDRGTVESIVLAFSFYTNGKNILNTGQSGSLSAIHGIRVLAIGWIVLGHTYLYTVKVGENRLAFALESFPQWHNLVAMYMNLSVDTFFAISGLLVSFLTLKRLKKVGGPKNINWLKFYLHRYIRITPAYMLILMVGTVVLPYILDGPLWNQDDFPQMKSCRQDWWAHLLYINNFYMRGESRETRCFDDTWYLANDMQFYVLSPILIVAFFYNICKGGSRGSRGGGPYLPGIGRKSSFDYANFAAAGLVVSLVFLSGVLFASGWIAYKYMYHAQSNVSQLFGEQPLDNDYFRKLYAPSYTRMGPYIIGIITGYLLYRCNCKCRINKLANLAGWFVSIGLTAVIVYSRHAETEADLFSRLGSAVFQSVHRTVWGVAVCWIIFACATGNGGWINELLSWKAFIPLGRLGLVTYLINPLVIFSFTTSRMVLTYYSIYEMIYLFLFFITFTYGVSFIVSMAFEAPFIGLENLLWAKLRKK